MKNRLFLSLFLFVVLAGAAWRIWFFPAKPPAASPVVSPLAAPVGQATASATAPAQSAPSTGPANSQSEAPPAAPLASTTAPTPAKDAAAPATPPADLVKPVTTLSELYRAFDTIDAAAMETTPSSLEMLVTYAATDNDDVRSAALAALVRRGDAAASPLLRAAAKKSDSTKQITELLQTADFLDLPPINLAKLPPRPVKPRDPNAPAAAPLPLGVQKSPAPATP